MRIKTGGEMVFWFYLMKQNETTTRNKKDNKIINNN